MLVSEIIENVSPAIDIVEIESRAIATELRLKAVLELLEAGKPDSAFTVGTDALSEIQAVTSEFA